VGFRATSHEGLHTRPAILVWECPSFLSTGRLAHILPRMHTSGGMVSSLKISTGKINQFETYGQLVTVWLATGSTRYTLCIEARTSRATVIERLLSLTAGVSWVIARDESSDAPIPQTPQGPSFRTGNAPYFFRPPMEWTAINVKQTKATVGRRDDDRMWK
jgi:hypothetical protein